MQKTGYALAKKHAVAIIAKNMMVTTTIAPLLE